MPELKQRKIPFQEVSELLMKHELNTGPKMADVLYMSTFTGLSRLKSPEDLSLTELRLIHRNGHVSVDELCNAIRAGL